MYTALHIMPLHKFFPLVQIYETGICRVNCRDVFERKVVLSLKLQNARHRRFDAHVCRVQFCCHVLQRYGHLLYHFKALASASFALLDRTPQLLQQCSVRPFSARSHKRPRLRVRLPVPEITCQARLAGNVSAIESQHPRLRNSEKWHTA